MTSKSLLIRKYAMFIAVFLVVIIVAVLFTRGGSNEIKIGVILPLTGDAQQFGTQIQAVFDYRLTSINDDPKVTFELVYRDGQCDPQAAKEAYKELTQDEKVQFILGGACSGETLEIAPLAEQDEVLVLSPTSSSSKIADYNNYVFTLSYPNQALAETLADHLVEFDSIALLSEDTAFNRDIHTLLNKELQERGRPNTVIFDRIFSPQDIDSSLEELARLSQEEVKPNAIFLNPNVGETALQLAERLQDYEELRGIQLYGQVAFNNAEVISKAPNALEGMIIFDEPLLDNSKINTARQDIVADNNEVDDLNDLNNYYIAASLDAIDILTGNIRENVSEDQDIDPSAVRDSLRKVSESDYLEDINFAETNMLDIGVGQYDVRNGKVEPRIIN